MPRYVATIPSAWPAARALTYMADFSHASEWDPSVLSSTALDAGPVRKGSTYELRIRSGRRVLRYVYRVERLEPGVVVLRAATRWFDSIDTISVRDVGSGSEITYDSSRRRVRSVSPTRSWPASCASSEMLRAIDSASCLRSDALTYCSCDRRSAPHRRSGTAPLRWQLCTWVGRTG